MQPEAEAIHAAERVHRLLAQPATLNAEDWLLIATLLVEADEARQTAQEANPSFQLPVLDEAVAELRSLTSNFTDPEFVVATKPPRRQRPQLFR